MRLAPRGIVLLWSVSGDDVIERIQEALGAIAVPFLLVDQRHFLETTVELEVGDSLRGRLRYGPWTVNLDEVRAFYVRPYDSKGLLGRDAPAGSDLHCRAADLAEILTAFADVTPALVVNRPAAMATNNSKPFQQALASRIGFAVPRTLITTDPQAVDDFCDDHREIVYKSISGVRSVVSLMTDKDRVRLRNVMTCPTQFQERVRGTNYRAHVVGSEVFACRIISSEVDYRYARLERSIESCVLPESVNARAVALARACGLAVAGVDLMQDARGIWYCFEANPSPGFTFFEQANGASIQRSIASLLAAGNGGMT